MQKFIVGTASDIEDKINALLHDGWIVKKLKMAGPGTGLAVKGNVIVAVVLQKDI